MRKIARALLFFQQIQILPTPNCVTGRGNDRYDQGKKIQFHTINKLKKKDKHDMCIINK